MDKKKCRDKLSLEMEERILLFVGNLVPVKGVDTLLNAFKLVREKDDNVVLIIIGDGPEKLDLEQQAHNLMIDKYVQFTERIDHNIIPFYINAADIIVQPSRKEGRGLVILEAFACGRPAVASRVGGIPETIVNDKLGMLVERENPTALADGIIKALECAWDSKYQSAYANEFTQDKLTPRVLKVYDEVLNSSIKSQQC